jgi:hypothetical protein
MKTMQRFVVLYHQVSPSREQASHWDLMLQSGSCLLTWALSSAPCMDRCTLAERLADHRTTYLDYEGPISRDRGNVTRWDHGHYEAEQESADSLRVILHGERLRGRATLRRESRGHRWWFAPDED